MAYERAGATYPTGPSQCGGLDTPSPRRQYRLDEVSNAMDANLKLASEVISKLRAVRERLSGPWPEEVAKNTACAARSGHIGRIEDQTIGLHEILMAVNEQAEHLLGV